MTTKRVYELEVGDVFRWMGTIHLVKKVTDKKIIFQLLDSRGRRSGDIDESFGSKSKMKVEIIKTGRPLKLKTWTKHNSKYGKPLY